ncbi:peroxisomal membrane protein 11A-like [Lycium barbarum]|uniref:peroxisomal membrane protein 11A-like n=1 Tax=Lycium barbarum TaxID=112863 RepID=UPI00293E6301|nr:peroxisomal membrane protein 11A-like [Lycium barbarum]
MLCYPIADRNFYLKDTSSYFLYLVSQLLFTYFEAGLIDKKNLNGLAKISVRCEFIGYIGSVSLKVKELRNINEDEECLLSTIGVSIIRGIGYAEEEAKLRFKKLMKRLSVIQDFADGLMALADIRDGKGLLSAPLLLPLAGLLSALISTRKNWISC